MPGGPQFQLVWQQGPFSADKGDPIALSSPTEATLDAEGPSVVVGDRSGYLYAFHMANGSPVGGWPAYDGGAPIDSTPSVAELGAGAPDTVFVGEGNAAQYRVGGFAAWSANGQKLWSTPVVEPTTDRNPAYAVQASLTVADLQGVTAVFAGSLGQETYALNAATGSPLRGWPFFSADSTFSTAAAADLYGNGQTELVVGGASTHGFAYGQQYQDGGHLRILDSHGGLICHKDIDQEIDSSPAVGDFLTGGATGIVVGTGSFYQGHFDTNVVDAFDTHCNQIWSQTLDGFTGSSPALADVLGDGSLDVVQGTDNGASGGVWLLNGATGQPIWHVYVGGRVIGSPVTTDLSGAGYQDILVPTTHGVYVLDGRNGYQLGILGPGLGFQNSPLVSGDPNGRIGITIAGYNGANEGVIQHYEIAGDLPLAIGQGTWPMFHLDPQLTGATGATGATTPAPSQPCDTPAAAADGYDMVSATGKVSSFGQPYCGSAAGSKNDPVVGITMAPNVGGYWVATADGQVSAFGSAQNFGSMAGHHLAAPVTGIAATPDGGGYWLVAADGGVFGFGDAHYAGSPPPGSGKAIAIASSPDGHGYLVATATGGVYNFGDAQNYGSMAGKKLHAPIVALTTDIATGGYWLASADGGVFDFLAPYEGTASRMHLSQPIVGMAATTDGRGYWLIAKDGGVFAFGDANFVGSGVKQKVTGPIASATGFSG